MSIKFFIDMDGTVCDTVGEWINRYNKLVPKKHSKTKEDFTTNNLESNIPEEYKDKFLSIINQEGFFKSLEFLPGAEQVINKLNSLGADIVFITKPPYSGYSNSSTRSLAIKEKIDWLYEKFSWFDEKNFIVVSRRDCLIGNFLIDDCPDNLRSFSNNGHPILVKHLFNESEVDDLKNNYDVLIMDNWNDLFSMLKEISTIMLSVYGHRPLPDWRHLDKEKVSKTYRKLYSLSSNIAI